MLAGRVSVVVGDGIVATPSLVRAVWTDDVGMVHSHPSPGCPLLRTRGAGERHRRGTRGKERQETCTRRPLQLGRPARLAAELGHDGTLQLLAGVVDVEDAATGTVRLEGSVNPAAEMALDTRSTKTVRIPSAG